MELALDDIVDIFSRKHPRRMTLPGDAIYLCIDNTRIDDLCMYIYFIDFFIHLGVGSRHNE